MHDILYRYFGLVQPGQKAYWLLRKGERSYYEAFVESQRRLDDEGRSWGAFVRAIVPRAPAGFEWIGRMQNASRKIELADPPRLLFPIPIPPEARGFIE